MTSFGITRSVSEFIFKTPEEEIIHRLAIIAINLQIVAVRLKQVKKQSALNFVCIMHDQILSMAENLRKEALAQESGPKDI